MIFLRWKLTFDRYEGFEIDTDGELRVAQELFENVTSLGASSLIDSDRCNANCRELGR